MVHPRVQARAGSFVLYDGEAFDCFPEIWFSSSYWRERERVVDEVAGRGSVLFVRRGEAVWVLRHYHRGGFIAGLMEDHYLWMGLERTRAFREWRLLRQLCGRGLPVPVPIAAHVTRKGLGYRADIITACIENTRSWASLVTSGEASEAHWRALGRTLRRFHDHGVDHADLNANNILLNEAGEVSLVDFDRGGLRGSGGWKRRNIARLLRSLRKITLETGAAFDDVGWSQLLSSYDSGR